MKYLSTYKLFESRTPDRETIRDLMDILLEIQHQGLAVVPSMGINGKLTFHIDKVAPEGRIVRFEMTQDLLDTLQRISDYVKNNGWKFITFEVYISDDNRFQMSASDLDHYLGEEVGFITVNISDYKLRESSDWLRAANLQDVRIYLDTVEDILIDIPHPFLAATWDEEEGGNIIPVVAINLDSSVENDWDWDDEDYHFKLNGELIEDIDRVIEFMNTKGYKCKITYGTDNIPPSGSVKLEDYYSEVKKEELEDLQWYPDNYLRLDFTR